MSWICTYCETENSDNFCKCEVCSTERKIITVDIESHFTYKGIPITGSIESIKKAFKAMNNAFKDTDLYDSHICGPLAGFSNAYIRFFYNEKYSNVTSLTITFIIDNPDVYFDFKKSLSDKYGSPSIDEDLIHDRKVSKKTIGSGKVKLKTVYTLKNGSIFLYVFVYGKEMFLKLKYADDTSLYERRIEKEKIKKRELFLRELAKDI